MQVKRTPKTLLSPVSIAIASRVRTSLDAIHLPAIWFVYLILDEIGGATTLYWRAALVAGTTRLGRATVQVLAMNADELLSLRNQLIQEGVF